MRNNAFNVDFDIMTHAADIVERLSDVEVSNLDGLKDLYGVPLQFGDPVLYLHLPKSIHKRSRDIEYANYVNDAQKPLHGMVRTTTHRYYMIKQVVRAFPDMKMISEVNIVRASNDYTVVFNRKNHLIIREKR